MRKRPGVDEFLARVAKLYEVIIFTASLPQYANPLLDLVRKSGKSFGKIACVRFLVCQVSFAV